MSGHNDTVVQMRDLRKITSFTEIGAHRSAIKSIDWIRRTPESSRFYLITGGGLSDPTVKAWDLDSQNRCVLDKVIGGQITGAFASSNGLELITTLGQRRHKAQKWSVIKTGDTFDLKLNGEFEGHTNHYEDPRLRLLQAQMTADKTKLFALSSENTLIQWEGFKAVEMKKQSPLGQLDLRIR